MNKEINSNDKFVSLTIIVNGTPTVITINENVPLKAAAEKALEQTKNTGRPLKDWEMKLESGQELDMSKKIRDFNFPDDIELYLSLDFGEGGNK